MKRMMIRIFLAALFLVATGSTPVLAGGGAFRHCAGPIHVQHEQ
jgi:hypothetical protein